MTAPLSWWERHGGNPFELVSDDDLDAMSDEQRASHEAAEARWEQERAWREDP